MGDGETESTHRIVGRYALHGVIASGGMANVHLGRLLGLAGFSRIVAIKRLHEHYARDPEFVSMLIDEARLAARIRHPNVVAMLDVVALEGELFLVMEYVHGESLSKLIVASRKVKQHIPLHILLTIMSGVLYGLHAAHEARNDRGEHIDLVHRDVSPQNIQVGLDGVARVLDFGIAKAAGRLQETREDQLKGRLRYMAPEQLRPGGKVDRRTDIYSASIVLWEGLTGQAVFKAKSDADLAYLIMAGMGADRRPSKINPEIGPELEEVIMRGLSVREEDRFQTAYDMAVALEEIGPIATPREVGQWVEDIAANALADRAAQVDDVEGKSRVMPLVPAVDSEDLRDSHSSGSYGSRPASPPLSTPALSPDPATRSKKAPVILAGLLGVGALVIALSIALSPEPLQAQSALMGLSSDAIRGLLARASKPIPDPTAPPTVTAPPSASASASASASSTPPKPIPVLRKPRANCNPPYFFDADGVKRLKRECM
jgi:serine/threonine-protein kinase